MSKYVLSDIHGRKDKFVEMLEKINFSDNDELYILGDVFDRGPDPIGVIDIIVSKKNIHLLLGNHEQMFIDFIDYGDFDTWRYNGGETTLVQIQKRGSDYLSILYKYVKELPVIKVVDNFILTHAAINFVNGYENMTLKELLDKQTFDFNIWSRDNVMEDKQFKDYEIIVGHTPVQTINGGHEIIENNHTHYIDCGAVFLGGKLACIRLEDMKQFYV